MMTGYSDWRGQRPQLLYAHKAGALDLASAQKAVLAVLFALVSILSLAACGSESREFVSISTRLDYTCGVLTDGKIVCWGDEEHSFDTPPPGEYRTVSLGTLHACGLRSDGSLACWGDHESYPAPLPPPGKFASVSVGGLHTCGVKTNGSAVCWGKDDYGRATPPPGKFASVSASKLHTCGVKTDGSLACWGHDKDGRSTPPPGKFASVSAGDIYTCGVKTDGSLVCWGNILATELHGGPYMPLSGKFASVNARGHGFCGVKVDGSVVCDIMADYLTPPPGAFKTVSDVQTHVCGILVDDTVECWGNGWQGQTTLPWEKFDATSCDREIAERLDRPSPHWPPSQEDWPAGGDLRGIEFSFDVFTEETVQISLTLRNITNETISWEAHGYGFRAMRVDDCSVVWRDERYGWMNDVNAELGPYEERVWSTVWEGETEGEDLVKPGEYLVYAFVRFRRTVGTAGNRESTYYVSLPYVLELK